jgi:hypothetical protein
VNLSSWSLWLDEGATWLWATKPTWGGTVFAEANHPPLWWVATRLWIAAFGDSVFVLRSLPALVGLLSVWLSWRLGLRLLDPAHAPRRGGFPAAPDGGAGRRTALWFTAFMAGAAYFLEFSQEARMYPALLAVTLGLTLLYLRWLDGGGRATLALYALLAAAGLYTHYFGVWPVVAHGAHALWLAWRTRGTAEPVRPLPFVAAGALAALAFAPWVVHLVSSYQGIAREAEPPLGLLAYIAWRIGIGPGLVITDRLRQEAGFDAVLAEERTTILVSAVLWTVPLLFGVAALLRRPGLRGLAVASLGVPVLCLLLVYPWFPLIHERYLLFLAPWLFLLAALGAGSAPRLLGPLLYACVVVLLATGTAAYLFATKRLVPEGRGPVVDGRPTPLAYVPDPGDPLRPLTHGHPYGREPWRDAHAFVRKHARPGDVVVLHPHYLHYVWDYYDRGDLDTLHLPPETLDLEAVRARLAADLAGRSRVFLVLAHEHTEDPDHYFEVLRRLLLELWAKDGSWSFQAVGPVLFHFSWGVRVAVFSRS